MKFFFSGLFISSSCDRFFGRRISLFFGQRWLGSRWLWREDSWWFVSYFYFLFQHFHLVYCTLRIVTHIFNIFMITIEHYRFKVVTNFSHKFVSNPFFALLLLSLDLTPIFTVLLIHEIDFPIAQWLYYFFLIAMVKHHFAILWGQIFKEWNRLRLLFFFEIFLDVLCILINLLKFFDQINYAELIKKFCVHILDVFYCIAMSVSFFKLFLATAKKPFVTNVGAHKPRIIRLFEVPVSIWIVLVYGSMEYRWLVVLGDGFHEDRVEDLSQEMATYDKATKSRHFVSHIDRLNYSFEALFLHHVEVDM